ncbi:MAG: zinc ABC transporter substrate-binding protein [Anaerolineae bacterium]|nr:zinc ABC transporter substrate-binding protein [Anaerolineae bacterium]
MNRSVRLILTALLLFSAASALPARAQDEPAALNAVATFSVLGDFVAQVGGERVNLTTLVPAGGDPHTFEPSPADSVALADADLIFEIGLGFETWLDDMVSASGTGARRVVLTDGLDLLPATPHEGGDEDHAGEDYDPHVWLDPQRVMIMIATIRDALIEADPEGEAVYRLNAENYVRELEMLDAELEAAFALVPEQDRQLITSHEAFAYLGDRYGFTVDSVLGITTESADPPAAALAAIIDRIRAAGVPAVFPETAVNPSLIEQIAADAGVSVGQPLFDVLGEPESDGDTYLAMMRHNALAIVSALAPAQ